MTDADRFARNESKLQELHPWMRSRVMGLLVDLEHDGWKPRIQDAWRSPEDQKKAFESGHTKLLYGYHNVTRLEFNRVIKEAFACDILREDDNVLVAEKEYCIALAHFALKQGLQTGIAWSFNAAMRAAVEKAVREKDLKANIKISWDPCHCEPENTSWLDKLKIGWRPGFNEGMPIPGRLDDLQPIPADSVLVKRATIDSIRVDLLALQLSLGSALGTVKGLLP